MTHEQMEIVKDFADMLTKQMDKINKKGDITPDELTRMDKAVDILKDIQVICAMEEYGKDPEPEMYSSMGYYGPNSRAMYPQYDMMPMMDYSGRGRNSMGRYMSSRGYTRDEAYDKMHSDLEKKYNNASTEREREMIRRCMEALDER